AAVRGARGGVVLDAGARLRAVGRPGARGARVAAGTGVVGRIRIAADTELVVAAEDHVARLAARRPRGTARDRTPDGVVGEAACLAKRVPVVDDAALVLAMVLPRDAVLARAGARGGDGALDVTIGRTGDRRRLPVPIAVAHGEGRRRRRE